ncbi:MAG: hypothetical protein RIR28_682, partial [Pseudomonadota bacterium]
VANASARYLVPLNKDGLTGAVGVVSSRSKPAGEAEALDVLSVSEALTARVRAPLHRSREFSLYGELGFSAIKSQTDLAGIKGYYSDRYDSADLSLQLVDWVTRFGSTSAALGYSQSVDDQSDSPTSDDYDRRQRKATLNFRHSLGLTESVSFSLLGQGQYANRPLLSGEKISFGGSGIGRGFEPGFMAGERGYGLSAELSYAAPVSLGESVQGRAQVFAFADSAKVESVATTGQVAASEKLYSLGLGLRFQVYNGLRAEILWAKPIRHDRPRQSISEGLFFTLSYSW